MSLIGQIKGTLEMIERDRVLVDVGGVGYEIGLPSRALAQLPEIGKDIKLFTHQVVKEDGQFLFGFLTREERNLFRLLISVSGVGPKLGLALLGAFELNQLTAAITKGDYSYLSSIPGVGNKTAQKIILELKEKITKTYGIPAAQMTTGVGGEPALAKDVMSALLTLGYSPREARQALAQVTIEEGLSIEQILKKVLSKFA